MGLIKNFPHDGIVTINRVILKEGHTLDELQERVALMCENVKTYHSETGFIGGMVVKKREKQKMNPAEENTTPL